ncbi:MAG: GAF domain-containing protein [Flavitalea sp.]
MEQVRATKSYDSEFCGNLPIHLINVVMPYGALIVFDKHTLKVLQASANIERATETEVHDLIGLPLLEFLSKESIELIEKKIDGNVSDRTPFRISVDVTDYLAILHIKDTYCLLEVNYDSEEEARSNTYVDVYQELKSAISSIESCNGTIEAAKITARVLKTASGFDKVMIYQFDSEWNGHVLAEEGEPDMESYLGFTFPASDIPKQARDLYLKNSYRFIPDRNYTPIKIYPVLNPDSQSFIDLSDCNVRGVSAVHIEYLKNMNVVASMSTRIIKDNKLWGLIACHHKTAKNMSYKMCSVFELMSNIISAKISSLSNTESLTLNGKLKEDYSRLIRDIYKSQELPNALLESDSNVLKLFNAEGAVCVYNSKIHRKGEVPQPHELDELLLWISAKEMSKVYVTNNLGGHIDAANSYKELASGLLVIPLDKDSKNFLLLFRPEVIQITDWGGDPSTRMSFEEDMKTYHPRFSFKLWREHVTGVSLPWKNEEIETARNMEQFLKEYAQKN